MLPSLLLLALAMATTPELVTHVQASYPSISPDGRTLLFQSTRSGRWALYLAAPDGSNVHMLVDSGDDPVTGSWSADGRRIAFAATVEGQSEIFIIDADGSNRRRLTNDPADDSHPHFAADGRIFFNSGVMTPTGELADIYSMNQDGSGRRRHTRCNAICTFPSPSPDGNWLAYRRVFATPGLNWRQERSGQNSEVVVARLDGRGERNLSRHEAFDGWPVWSPDSQWIAFASNRDGAPLTGQVYAIRPDGQSLRRVTGGPLSNVQPSFAPDGASILTYTLFETPEQEAGSIGRWPFAAAR